MRLYRIAPEKYLENYNGIGGSFSDGARWNSPNHPVIYFALSAATALLEMGNYLPSPRLIPKHYRLGIYSLPDDVAIDIFPEKKLPKDWANFPYPKSTQEIGTDWLSKKKKLGLLVPSAAVPEGLEKILVVNPGHEHINKIKLIKQTSSFYNERIFAGID